MEKQNSSIPKKVLGVELAPLSLPLSRRLETFAVASWIYSFFILGPFGLILVLYIFFFTKYYYLAAIYAVYLYFDIDVCNQGGRRSEWVRRWSHWRNYCNYYPISLVKTADLDPTKNYLFASHPHGVLCSGTFGCFATEGRNFSDVFPGITPHLLTLEGHYSFPIYRDYMMLSGACSASRKSLNYLLTHPDGGHAAVLIPGGAPEALDSHPGPEVIVHLKRRKGFVKVAIQNGAPLVPIFSFGETEIYTQVKNPEGSKFRAVQNWLQSKMGLAPVVFMGRGIFQYSFGIVPKRHPIYVVVGRPVPTVKCANPSQEQIDETHKRYGDTLMELFDNYKHLYATPEHKLVYV